MALAYDALLSSYAGANLAAQWKLADAAGSSTAADSSGNGNTGTLVTSSGSITFGQTGFLPGTPADTCAAFSGTTAYISTSYKPGGSALTLIAWFNATSEPTNTRLVSSSNVGLTTYGIEIITQSSGNIKIDAGNGSTNASITTSGTNYLDGHNHMVVVTYDGTNLYLYVDGSFVSSTALSGSIAATDPLYIGALEGTGDNYSGNAGQIAVVTSTFNSTQVSNLWAARNTLDLPNPPAGVSAAATSTGAVNLFWIPGTAVPDAVTGWQVTGYELGVGQISSQTVAATPTSQTISTLSTGAGYWWTVAAINALGDSSVVQSNTVFPQPINPPTPPYYTAPFTTPLTYSTYDLYSGAYLGHLPFTQVTFGDQLDNPGQFSGQIDIASQFIQNLDPVALTMPGRTVLIVDYQGAVIWSGIIWTRNYDFSSSQTNRNLTINATAMWSYFQQRNQATDYSSPPYSGITGLSSEMAIWDATAAYSDSNYVWDPMLIAWQVISDAMSATYGNPLGGLGILANSFSTTAGYLASGTETPQGDYVSVSYPYTSIQSVHTIVSQLASNGLNVGFDFGLDVAYSNGPGSVLVGTVNLSYPRRGRTYANNNLVLNCGQALTYSFPEDATQMANVVYEQGISSSLIVSENLYPLEQGYALIEKTISRANITNANILNILTFLGVSDLYLYSYAVVTPTVTMDMFSSSVPLGSFITGDDVRLIVPETDGAGNIWDPRFPDGLDQEWRITGYSAQVQDQGESTIQFQLTQPPGLVALEPWL